MIRSNKGYSLLELMIVLGIFTVVIALSAAAFKSILTASARESKSIESQISDIVGLELLRLDIEHAGYGLPWRVTGVTYAEASTGIDSFPDPGKTNEPSDFNETSGAPRMIRGENDDYVNNSDYLVIRSTVVARNAASGKWSYVSNDGIPKVTGNPAEDVAAGDRVIIVRPAHKPTYTKELVVNAGQFYGYSTATTSNNYIRNFYPVQPSEKRLIYGLVDSGIIPRMPHNRADYYIRRPAATEMYPIPQRCGPKTGILFKGIVNNIASPGAGAGELTELPLMDCVADFQVVFGRDADPDHDGDVDSHDDINVFEAAAAEDIRQELKEVWVFILTHDGKGDKNYRYPSNNIFVGAETGGGMTIGKNFDLSTLGTDAATGLSWENFRWRVHSMVVKPKNI